MRRKSQVSNNTIEPCSYLNDEQVIEHASKSEQGEKFQALMEGNWQEGYDSQSDADMAFVSILAFWCGNVEEQIDRIFRTSGLMRDKWDRMTGDATYGQITIRNAVSTNDTIYMPIRDKDSAEEDFGNLDDEAVQASFEPDLSKVSMTLEEMQPHTNPRYQREEIGIGYAFADYFKPIARFDRERGIWYVFDGKVWQPDENALAVAELAKRLADRLYTLALQIKDEDTRNRYIKRVQKLQMRKNRRTMIEDAKSVYPVPHSVFDRNTDLFNCQNGTLNLTTGEFKAHDPADFLTLMSGITYDPDAACPRWDTFISEVMCGDEDLALYLQKALGYALTGDTSLECLFILYGATSRNGKGTTMETFLRIMGDYGKTSNPEMLSTKFGNTNASGPSEEIARLAGVRFVNISEPEKKITFNAALVKRMTGNDTLNARFLHENSFDFKPNFKIFINTNYKPSVSDMTLFYSNRLKLIPFKRHFEEHEQDKGLKNFFAEAPNLSAIFNWCYEGYKQFKASDLADPLAVTQATKEYAEESDRIGQFVDAWLEAGEAYEVVFHLGADGHIGRGVVVVVQQNIAGKQIASAGQILGIGEQLEARLGQRGAHIAGIGAGVILEGGNTQQITGCRDIGTHTSRAVGFAGNRDLRRLPSHSFELFEVGAVLALIVADAVIQCGVDTELGDLQRDLLIGIAENTGPGPRIPVPHAPFLPGLVASLSARVVAVLVGAGVGYPVRTRGIDVFRLGRGNLHSLLLGGLLGGGGRGHRLRRGGASELGKVLLTISGSLHLNCLALIGRPLKLQQDSIGGFADCLSGVLPK